MDIIVLAAGNSSRMKSQKSKLFLHIGNYPILAHTLSAAASINPSNIIIVTNKDNNQQVQSLLKNVIPSDINTHYAIQRDQKGTGGAVISAIPYIKSKNVIILYGDVPLVNTQTLQNLYKRIKNNIVALLFKTKQKKHKYGSAQIDDNDFIVRISESNSKYYNNATDALLNSGLFGSSTSILKECINQLEIDTQLSEYLLTDIFNIATKNNYKCSYFLASEKECSGINTLEDLSIAEEYFQNTKRKKMLENEVILIAPETVFFSYDTKIDATVIIHPYVIFGPNVIIEKESIIYSFSDINESYIKNNCQIGPHARLRNNNVIEENSMIGNFAEIKHSTCKKNSKIKHFSYIGNTTLGSGSNIGAGTVTCNYDGKNKHNTYIGNNCFIGGGAMIVAPIRINNDSFVAAGTVVTKNVPQNEMAISRIPQINKKLKNDK